MDKERGSFTVKKGLAQMLKGGVIMDVVTPDHARIAEEAGACAVMALERVPADIRAQGGVARMSDPGLIQHIMETVTIPVMAKCRIGHFVEAQVLEAIGVDFIDESEVLTPADEEHHILKHPFGVPFVCGARNLGEALRRIGEGAAMIRTKGEAGTGNVVEAVRHIRTVTNEIRALTTMDDAQLMSAARDHQAPYDLIGDYFRGATGMMKDLYRNKDKLLLLLDKAVVFILRQTIAAARQWNHPIVFIPTHWAPDAFMSPKQFETFWWPSFRKLLIGLIDAGLIPMPLWESDCTKRLETIRDIPAGKCIYWFERTDMVKAFEVLGDVVALRGNLSPSLLTTGKPEEVDAAVRHLADNVFHKGGKLILDAAFGLPDETPVENARAMYRAARKYGS